MDTDQLATADILRNDTDVDPDEQKFDDLLSGLDWQGMFPLGSKRMTLLRVLRDALMDVELVSQGVNT